MGPTTQTVNKAKSKVNETADYGKAARMSAGFKTKKEEVIDTYGLDETRLHGKFTDNTRGSQFMSRGVDIAVGILVVGLLTAYLLPIAIDEIVAVDTTGWGNAEAQLFDLLPLFFVLAILLFIVAKAMQNKKRA